MALLSGSGEKPADGGDKPPKKFWETVLTTTPVMLTVLATLLAGLSSGEMTRAQYYRSLAAQYQSKAGDQWGFFQAKRIRSTTIEQALDEFSGKPVPISAEKMLRTFQQLQERCDESAKLADRLQSAVAKEFAAVRNDGRLGDAWRQALVELVTLAREKAAWANQALDSWPNKLKHGDVPQALAYLGSSRLPSDENQNSQSSLDSDFTAAIQAIQERRPEWEIASLAAPLGEARISATVAAVEKQAKQTDETNRRIDKNLRDLDQLVKQFMLALHGLIRAVGELGTTSSELSPPLVRSEEIDHVAGLLRQWAETIPTYLQTLRDYQACRKDFTVRRENREAQDNQKTAWLYELRVHLNSETSDRHRQRSQHFFFGMLGAQAGTAIASLALAARHKSSLWGLASLAGLAALAFSIYVYLFV